MATKVNIVIDQGTTFETTINLTNEDGTSLEVTGDWYARAQIRKHYTSSNAVSFATDLSNGALILSLSEAQTANMVAGRYVYDVELIDASNNVSRLIEGVVTLTPEVTKS
jgi:hypothetical protein